MGQSNFSVNQEPKSPDKVGCAVQNGEMDRGLLAGGLPAQENVRIHSFKEIMETLVE